MLKFVKNIQDFWSQDLENFKFTVLSPLDSRARENWTHPNFQESKPLEQAFDDDLPPYWGQFVTALGLKEGTVSWTNIQPGQVLPVHADKFFKLRTKYGVDITDCQRYLIFLSDWVLGHSVDFEEQVITRWKKGDVWTFDHTSYHWGANGSQVNFITCQVNTIKD